MADASSVSGCEQSYSVALLAGREEDPREHLEDFDSPRELRMRGDARVEGEHFLYEGFGGVRVSSGPGDHGGDHMDEPS